MKIIGKQFNIEEIRFGHESESHAFGYITKTKNIPLTEANKNPERLWTLIDAHENGFECGIKWLASYLAEYGIKIELHDTIVKTTSKEHWYSGEIVNKNNNI